MHRLTGWFVELGEECVWFIFSATQNIACEQTDVNNQLWTKKRNTAYKVKEDLEIANLSSNFKQTTVCRCVGEKLWMLLTY